MAFRAVCVALLLSSLPIAGCGTVANLVKLGPEGGEKIPFGGVQRDVECISTTANGKLGYRTPPKSDSDQHLQVALMLFCAADLPFTLVGDLVTWPYTAAYTCINQPTPVPPVTHAAPPAPQAPTEDPAQTPPLQVLPKPAEVPEK